MLKAIMKAIVWIITVLKPRLISGISSIFAIAGSPIQPRARELKVIPN